MITGGYIVLCELYGNNGELSGKSNVIFNDARFESVIDFYDAVKSKLLEGDPNINNVIIVGVFKL